MTKKMDTIIQKSEVFVTHKLGNEINEKYLYHNLRHTQRVVNSTKELIDGEKVTEKDKEKLLVASWFHDLGYLESLQDHEEQSCRMAREFLSEEGCDKSFVDAVCALIMATKMYYVPKDDLEKIMRDSDSSHFAKKSFVQTSELLREELSLLGLADFTIDEWRKENINLLRVKHRYFTDFAKEN
ncbi:HD domain-containing protein [Maribacter sp. CXY002]|uniref:HD domain-containing protein n=1 Tax=Maribacter luteocoastalis TaxID=3407671 RepID=UPI003B67FAA9